MENIENLIKYTKMGFEKTSGKIEKIEIEKIIDLYYEKYVIQAAMQLIETCIEYYCCIKDFPDKENVQHQLNNEDSNDLDELLDKVQECLNTLDIFGYLSILIENKTKINKFKKKIIDSIQKNFYIFSKIYIILESENDNNYPEEYFPWRYLSEKIKSSLSDEPEFDDIAAKGFDPLDGISNDE